MRYIRMLNYLMKASLWDHYASEETSLGRKYSLCHEALNKSESFYIFSKGSATLKGAPVLLLISATVTPSAISVRVSPSTTSTWKTPSSVIIVDTHCRPVRGNAHSKESQKRQPYVIYMWLTYPQRFWDFHIYQCVP